MATEINLKCWSCGGEVRLFDKITRNDFCPHCDMPLKCCYNCRFYDKDAYHQCTEPQAEWVRYKEKANLCSYFVPRPIRQESQAPPEPKKQKASKKKLREPNDRITPQADKAKKDRRRAAWDSLFKDDD
jgi:hypothetical protein